MDTAGLRDSQEIIEKKGIARSRSIIDEAGIVVFLADGASWKEDEAKIIAEFSKIDEKKLILVWNKADIAPPPPQNFSFLPLSAKTGEGINELEMKILSKIDVLDENKTDFEQGGAGLGSERQKKLALEAASALEAALELHSRNTTLDIISASVRAAVDALGEITGEISTSDILETMFSRFCIGK